MLSFIEWFDKEGFYAKDVWDLERGKWIHDTKLQLFPFQRDIFTHVFTPDEDGNFPYSEVVLSQRKKSGKTLELAMILAWAGECGPVGSEIYSVANDQEQAEARAFTDLEYHTRKKFGILAATHKIVFPSGSTIIALAQHYASAAGSRPLLSGFDELWAFVSEKSRRMWAEMTPPPSVENAMRVTVTYAGYENESNQLLDLYNLCFKKENGEYVNGEVVPELAHIVDQWGDPVCRRSGRTFIFWDTSARMPWQTEEYYSSQLTTLRPSDFMRMHLNRWASSSETFIPIELFDECVKDDLLPVTYDPQHKFRNYPLALAVDIGPKHDTSAVVGTYYDFERKVLGVACHKIFIPPEKGVLDIEATVEAYILDVCKKFNVTAVLFDPYQFYRSSVTLQRKQIPMVEFPQTAGNMIGATETLYEALRARKFETYRSDELRDHLRYASAETNQRGSRLTKGKHAKYPIDAAVALAMSGYWSVKYNGIEGETEIVIESPFSDVATLQTISDMEKLLPPELRSSYA